MQCKIMLGDAVISIQRRRPWEVTFWSACLASDNISCLTCIDVSDFLIEVRMVLSIICSGTFGNDTHFWLCNACHYQKHDVTFFYSLCVWIVKYVGNFYRFVGVLSDHWLSTNAWKVIRYHSDLLSHWSYIGIARVPKLTCLFSYLCAVSFPITCSNIFKQSFSASAAFGS